MELLTGGSYPAVFLFLGHLLSYLWKPQLSS
jgi:hypothetical protein